MQTFSAKPDYFSGRKSKSGGGMFGMRPIFSGLGWKWAKKGQILHQIYTTTHGKPD
jgi:hypothetical protein